jgi:hypothetical protein
MKRNDELIMEVQRLHSLNRDMQSVLSEMLKRDLRREKKTSEIGTQTEDRHLRKSLSMEGSSRLKRYSADKIYSPQETDLESPDVMDISRVLFRRTTPPKPTRTPLATQIADPSGSLRSPLTTRISPILVDLFAEGTAEKASHLRNEELMRARRSSRSGKTPITYKETPLNVRVTKSFKFFKFKEK